MENSTNETENKLHEEEIHEESDEEGDEEEGDKEYDEETLKKNFTFLKKWSPLKCLLKCKKFVIVQLT